MAFLTIAGFGDLEVDSDGAAESEPEEGGEDTRSINGTLRTAVEWTKRNWEFNSGWLTPTQYGNLKAAVAAGAHVDCSGDALGATVKCRVRVVSGAYIDEAGTVVWRQAKLRLIEV